MAYQPTAVFDECLEIAVRVVNSSHKCIFERDTTIRRAIVVNQSALQVRQGPFASAWHDVISGLLNCRVKGNRQSELFFNLRESLNAWNNAASRNSYPSCANVQQFLIIADAQCFDYVVEVEERLTLSHDNDIRNSLREIVLNLNDLIDDLANQKISREALMPGGAEVASHCAARLA